MRTLVRSPCRALLSRKIRTFHIRSGTLDDSKTGGIFDGIGHPATRVPCNDVRVKSTDIRIPSEVFALLEATAIANGFKPEEVVLAAIEAFLDNDREPLADLME